MATCGTHPGANMQVRANQAALSQLQAEPLVMEVPGDVA